MKTWYKNCVTIFVVTLCDDGTESSKKKLLQCVCMKRFANRATLFSTVLSSLALGHEIDRHFWRGVGLK